MICQNLKDHDLALDCDRVVLEKPLGNNLETCHEIHESVAKVFDEHHTFRIDHYLGKETVRTRSLYRWSHCGFAGLVQWKRGALMDIRLQRKIPLISGINNSSELVFGY